MSKISWQEGLFRIYLGAGLIGLLLLLASGYFFIKFNKYRNDGSEACESLVRVTDIMYATCKNLPESYRLHPYITGESQFVFVNHLASIRKGIDSGHSQSNDNLDHNLELYSQEIESMYPCEIERIRLWEKNAEKKGVYLLLVGGALFVGPWIVHYFFKLGPLPLLAWIKKGFTRRNGVSSIN